MGLRHELRSGDILILHEGWVTSNYYAAAIARRRRVPYVVVPQGVYERGIREGLRAERVRRLAERALLVRALAVHVSFESEIVLARSLCDRVHALVAPMGVVIPTARWTSGSGYVAWFGRYDPVHKGLDHLLRAISCLAPSDRPQLRMRGYDFMGGKRRVESMVKDLGLRNWVEVGPRVDGEDKTAFLQAADVYIHPSRWESHSVALLETLALGVPTVVSDQIHVAPLLRVNKAAAVVSLKPDDLAAAILRSRNDRRLGASGRRFVASKLSWPIVVGEFFDQLHALSANV